MRNRTLLTAFAALSLASAAYGQGADVSETIPLHYLAATSVPTTVKTVPGIDRILCNLKTNSVTISGSQTAVAAYKTQIQAADVQVATYRIEMRLVRYHVDRQGKSVETVLMTPTIRDQEKSPASISVTGDSGYALRVTPRQDGEKAAMLTVEVQELGEQGEVVRSGKNTRSVKLGEPVRITGMTDATDKTIRRAVQHGEIVTDRGEYTGYYVEVKTILEAPGH